LRQGEPHEELPRLTRSTLRLRAHRGDCSSSSK
jgi:hypothetical protein